MEERPPETVVARHPATGLGLSLHAAAVNAVMAGCLPEHFPVVVAAFEAVERPDFNFHGLTASTGGSAPLLIVSGLHADAIGMNSDVNLFGPGNRANGTIGRAVRLILRNVFQMLPGISDKSTQGSPGKCSFCISLGQSVVVLAPEHMKVVADAGWSREDVQDFFFAQARRPVEGMKAAGEFRDREYDARHGEKAHALAEAGFMHRGLRPDDILVTMAAGDAGGHSCFIPSWSRGRASIMQHAPIAVPAAGRLN
ncbi:MAG: hypothetical protein AB7F22_31315 [Reyranella sp.]|uniref:hypothetical protein n=1 Tax=Reyranella sp. TaxID=1929291 RepID=UPI003D0B224B